MRPHPLIAVPLLAALGALAACAAEDEGPTPPTVETTWRGEGAHLEISVWHMHCAGCEISVEEAVAGVDGVLGARADRETATVAIELDDPAARESVKPRIRTALTEAGFTLLGPSP